MLKLNLDCVIQKEFGKRASTGYPDTGLHSKRDDRIQYYLNFVSLCIYSLKQANSLRGLACLPKLPETVRVNIIRLL